MAGQPGTVVAGDTTLTELRQWNLDHVKSGAIKYGQSRLEISDEMDLEADRARYEADHRKDLLLSRDKWHPVERSKLSGWMRF